MSDTAPKAVADTAEIFGENKISFEAPPETPVLKTPSAVFIRNVLHNATVRLDAETEITFQRYLFETSDEALIQKLDAEGHKQHILRRERT